MANVAKVYQTMIKNCRDNDRLLSSWEESFITSLEDYLSLTGLDLSTAQKKKLTEIDNRVRDKMKVERAFTKENTREGSLEELGACDICGRFSCVHTKRKFP